MVTMRTPDAIRSFEPAVDLGGIEIVAVGMAQRNVERANVAVGAPGDADAADITIAPRPGRAAIGAQPLVTRLGVERDDARRGADRAALAGFANS